MSSTGSSQGQDGQVRRGEIATTRRRLKDDRGIKQGVLATTIAFSYPIVVYNSQTVQVNYSRMNTNRKPYASYRMILFPMTLRTPNPFQGHAIIRHWNLAKFWIFNVTERHVASLWQLNFLHIQLFACRPRHALCPSISSNLQHYNISSAVFYYCYFGFRFTTAYNSMLLITLRLLVINTSSPLNFSATFPLTMI